jgi:hypothetical protein
LRGGEWSADVSEAVDQEALSAAEVKALGMVPWLPQ